MSYLGEDLTITQLLFALNTKLSEKVRPSEYVPTVSFQTTVLMLA